MPKRWDITHIRNISWSDKKVIPVFFFEVSNPRFWLYQLQSDKTKNSKIDFVSCLRISPLPPHGSRIQVVKTNFSFFWQKTCVLTSIKCSKFHKNRLGGGLERRAGFLRNHQKRRFFNDFLSFLCIFMAHATVQKMIIFIKKLKFSYFLSFSIVQLR